MDDERSRRDADPKGRAPDCGPSERFDVATPPNRVVLTENCRGDARQIGPDTKNAARRCRSRLKSTRDSEGARHGS